jgi:hypothetical protein
MEYVALASHSPEACPGSNATVRERTEQAMGKLEEIGKEHQVKLKSAYVLSPKHLVVFIFEAAGIEAVRDFLQESGIAQWNDTELYPSQTMQEAMQSTSSLPPIW